MLNTYTRDVKPNFRPMDVSCMARKGVQLDSADWMCAPAAGNGFADHGNARHVFERLSDGSMPPDGGWDAAKLDAYSKWMTDGFQR